MVQAQWARQLEATSRAQGLLALADPVYQHVRLLYSLSGLGLISVLVLLSVISTLKPWLRLDRAQHKLELAAAGA